MANEQTKGAESKADEASTETATKTVAKAATKKVAKAATKKVVKKTTAAKVVSAVLGCSKMRAEAIVKKIGSESA
ncbi:MAG: hypothetical protein AAGA03_14635, partial [Planctomycetota bacterium]